MDVAQSDNMGLVETIKNSVQPETVAHRFGVDKNLLIDIGVYGAIGFITGYLLKKYSEYFIAIVLLLIGIVVLQQFDFLVLSFNSVKIQQSLGLPDVSLSADAYGNLLLEWIRSHVSRSASLFVGFLIGLKVG